VRLEGRKNRKQLQEALQIAILLERERKTREFAVSFKSKKDRQPSTLKEQSLGADWKEA
jgi:hypothetical protein